MAHHRRFEEEEAEKEACGGRHKVSFSGLTFVAASAYSKLQRRALAHVAGRYGVLCRIVDVDDEWGRSAGRKDEEEEDGMSFFPLLLDGPVVKHT
jgi:hypothetical protein